MRPTPLALLLPLIGMACAPAVAGDPIVAAVREHVRAETAVDSVGVVVEAVEGEYDRLGIPPAVRIP